MVAAEIKCEPTFETVFACVDVQSDQTFLDNFVVEETGTEMVFNSPRKCRTDLENEKLKILQNKIDLVNDELNFERFRGIKLEKELEKLNKSLKDMEKSYGFGIDCF